MQHATAVMRGSQTEACYACGCRTAELQRTTVAALGLRAEYLAAALQGAVQQPVAEVMATEETKRKDLQGKVGRLQSLRVNVSTWTSHARTEHACHTCSRRFASQAEQDAFIARKARPQDTAHCQACHLCLKHMHHHTTHLMSASIDPPVSGVNHEHCRVHKEEKFLCLQHAALCGDI